MTAILTLEQVKVSYGTEKVLRGISCSWSAGDVCLILGANGGGKSTLLRTAAGLSTPNSGKVTLADDAFRIGHLGHSSFLYLNFTVIENLTFYASLAKLKVDLSDELERWDLNKVKRKKVRELSKGTQARVGLCRSMLHRPNMLLLDEPTAPLDEHGVNLLLRNLVVLKERVHHCAIAIATHDISRVASFATRALVIESGVVRADTATSQLPLDVVIDEYKRHNR